MNTDTKRSILASLMQRPGLPPAPPAQSHESGEKRRPTSVLSGSSGMQSAASKQHKLSKRFTVIKKLGKGTYGKVQLAINKETGQEVAIKTIKKSKIDNEEDMQRVRREIQIMRSIEHPHIIHIYEEFENKDKIVLIMQYAPGGELYEHVSQSKILDDGEARRLFRQIATAIYYCHQNKICHRDLKLENILLDEKNNAKLADFGLSNVFDKQSKLKTFCGSPLYASPEIVQGSPYKGPEVDCWSLGVLLYTLVYGAMPFDGSNFKRLVKQISDASYHEPSERSPASPLIRHLLCADPNRRATIIDICSDPWVNGHTGAPLSPPVQRQVASLKNDAAAYHQHHPSLLKVAQDMANLTPVRIDMLLALTMGEQSARQQREAEAAAAARPPLAPIVAVNTVAVEPPKRVVSPQQAMTLNCEATLMEIDGSGVTSPIASYIVRDLEPPPASDKRRETPIMELVVDDTNQETEEEETAEISVEQGPVVIVDDEQREQATIEIVSRQQDQLDQSDQAPLAEEEEAPQEKEQQQPEVPKVDDDQRVESANEIDEGLRMEVEEQKMADNNLVAQATPQVEPDNLKTEQSARAAKEEVEMKSDPDLGDDKKETVEGGAPIKDEVPTETDCPSEAPARAKKLKKKIIVVKKKKRVSKKDAAPEDAAEEQQQQPVEDKSNDDQAATTKQQPAAGETKSKPPGKVRIPDTFQASEIEASQGPTPSHSRRQSALIADVSQKLLQSVSADPKPVAPTIIESDQLQLKNVRVSDKKEELERRASLAQQQLADLQLAAQRSQSISPASIAAEQQVEALQAELVREMQSSCAVDTLDLIPKHEPHSTGPATLVAWVPEAAAEPDQSLQLLQTPPTDERSDSLETIKADQATRPDEEGHPASSSVRSSLQIDLSPLRDVCDEMWQEQEAASVGSAREQPATAATSGPTPIARSYKKVTFTKDGACITETGKIYSAQADDGTLRRVERKSKVTHYPAQPGDTSGKSSKVHKEEEIVYCDNAQSGPHRQRHLERLIMPSRFAAGDSDSDNDDDFLSQARGSSLFSQDQEQHEERRRGQQQQRDRAGSASSCSSGSTDVLEDIFDTWTGAISMFNRPSSKLFERAASRLSWNSFGRRRQHHTSSSQAGTPRCESVEPQMGAGQRQETPSDGFKHQQSSSGYESDAAGGRHERRGHQRGSARAPRSARGLFGSWNLLNDLDTDEDLFGGMRRTQRQQQQRPKQRDVFAGGFDKRDPFEIMEQEQQSLRERLARQHKQLWKGSTPSLFDGFAFGNNKESTSKKPPPPVAAKDPRLPASSGRGHSSSTSGQVDQSQSSNSFKQVQQQQQQQTSRQIATPLEAAPIRRNTTNFSPIIRKSTSSSQSTTTHSFIREPEVDKNGQQQATTFIELKRTSSSLGSRGVLRSCSSKLRIQQQQQQQQQETSAHTNEQSTSSSSLLNNRETPARSFDTHSQTEGMAPLTPSSAEVGAAARQSPARESIDRRVQSWLQESSGNLSATSSGSKSSQSASISDSLHSGRRAHDPFENLYGSLWQSSSSSRTSKTMDASALPGQVSPGRQQKILKHSTSGSVVVSKQQQQQSTLESADCSSESAKRKTMTMLVEQSQQSQIAQTSIRETSGAAAASLIETCRASGIIMKQAAAAAAAKQASPSMQTNEASSTPLTASSTKEQQIKWMQQSLKQTNSRILSGGSGGLGDDLDFDSLSGDLESRSSSSLLDQLKTKGYRSMINKRMVDVSESAAKLSSESKVIDEKVAITTSIVQESYSHSSRISKQSQQQQQQDEEEDEDEDEDEEGPREISISATSEAQQAVVLIRPDGAQSSSTAGAKAKNSCLESPDKPDHGDVETIEHENEIGTEKSSEPNVAEEEEEEEEEDEDVREAKANIKAHLDRVRETELFLKSLKKEEENYERQRQQMTLFNDLMLGTKLNGFRSSFLGLTMMDGEHESAGDSSFHRTTTTTTTNTGLRSAPVRSYRSCDTNEQENAFLPPSQLSSSAALSFEPTYVLPFSNYNRPIGTSMANDPFLEPVQSLFHTRNGPFSYKCGSDHSLQPMDRFRRSRSQLSDQFTDFKRCSIDHSTTTTATTTFPIVAPTSKEIYYPSRAKRSMSQLRPYSSNRLSQPVAMSEYRSAYGSNPSLPADKFNNNRDIISSDIEMSARCRVKQEEGEGDDDDDDGMSAYRASSYVAKVVPTLTTTTTRGRSREKRRSYVAPSKVTALDDDGENKFTAGQRRSSLQVSHGISWHSKASIEPEPEQELETTISKGTCGSSCGSGRRRSLTTASESSSTLQKASSSGENNSRLSELEQRIKENRRRREELLAGKLSPGPTIATTGSSQATETSTLRRRRESSPAASPARSISSGLLGRPSRLESMEARIKRKSYCVRVGADSSPERAHLLRGQVSLEKWRQNNQTSSGSSMMQNRSDSLALDSSNLLIANMTSASKRRSSIGGATKATDDEQD